MKFSTVGNYKTYSSITTDKLLGRLPCAGGTVAGFGFITSQWLQVITGGKRHVHPVGGGGDTGEAASVAFKVGDFFEILLTGCYMGMPPIVSVVIRIIRIVGRICDVQPISICPQIKTVAGRIRQGYII